VKSVARIEPVIAAAVILLGCQTNKNTPDDPARSVVEEPSEHAAAVEPAAAPKPAATPEEANPITLVDQVKELTQMRTVEQTDAGIKITYVLEQAVGITDASPSSDVSDAMMFAAFYTAPLVYARLSGVDGLEQVFLYRGKTIGTIQTTRASFESLSYADAIAGVTDKKAKRPIYRKLLSRLPEGAVAIDKKYRP